jgi:STAS-like domain of unknown function (DUF4325)
MSAVSLPANTSQTDLLEELHKANALTAGGDNLVLQIPPNFFITTDALAFLAAWGIREKRAGREIRFFGERSALGYLSRLDLLRYLQIDFKESFERHPEEGRFIPIRLIEDEGSVGQASHAICDLVLAQFDNAREFLPAMEWAVYEIIDNVRLHSNSQSPGTVVAQYYPQLHRLDIAICDVGRGIYASLSESRKLWSHGDAITNALQRGVTRNPQVGQGNGLAGSVEIVKVNRGSFQIWTGDAMFRVGDGENKGFRAIPPVPGTGVLFQLDTRRPVDLRETFISHVSDGGWSYLNFAAERIEDEGAIRVVDKCANTGSREAAIPLRRQIQALLPEMEKPVVLDFSGVEMASSSFLDELLGRLALSLGPKVFHDRVIVEGASRLVAEMATVVIQQRLEGREPTGDDPST